MQNAEKLPNSPPRLRKDEPDHGGDKRLEAEGNQYRLAQARVPSPPLTQRYCSNPRRSAAEKPKTKYKLNHPQNFQEPKEGTEAALQQPGVPPSTANGTAMPRPFFSF